MIGVLTYFHKFQIKQSERGISINKERYVNGLLRMYDKIGSSVNTPIMPPNMLGPNLNRKAVNEPQYKGMIGSQTNQTASRHDIQFSTDLSERHQANIRNPTLFLLRIFRNAIGAHYLPHSSKYVAPPSIDIVRPWFETIGYGEAFPAKGTLKKSLLPPRWSIFWEDIIIKLNKKHREKVVPYTRFLSLLMMHKMKEGYGAAELTLYPTQVFSVNNWALKPKKPKEPPFTYHMLAICAANTLVVFKAPKTSSKAESVSQGTKPGAKSRHKKLSTSSKQPSMSSKEETKGRSSKAPTSSKTGHSKKIKESSSAMDSNPIHPPVSTPMDTGVHKEDQQATGGPTSLGVTTSFIIHTESASGNGASAASIAEADLRKSAPSDFVPQQQGMNEGTKNTSYDHLFAGTNPHVLADQSKSVSEGLETVLTQPKTGKGANFIDRHVKEEEASNTIKLEDLAKLVSKVHPSFKDLNSLEDDPVIVVDDIDEDEEDVHTTTKDTSVPKSSSPKSYQIQELTNQVLILQS
ncbi:hypothetical protein Tco_1358117 [Tanacetum coccineum]